jgi:hypothetical protein
MAGSSGDSAVAVAQFNAALYLAQDKAFGTGAAKPEVLNLFTLCGKAVKPASIQTHEQLGTARVGALGNHGPTTNAIFFDAR